MQKYALSSRLIHWFMALIIIFLLGLGIYMTDFLSKESENRMMIYNLHKSFGALMLFFIFIRIINRLIKKAPALPNTMPKYEIALAHLAHFGLYILMILVPLSGYLMSNLFGYPVKLFFIELPKIAATNFELGKLFSEIHEVSAFTLLGLIVLHVLGVIKHRFFDRPENNILNRML